MLGTCQFPLSPESPRYAHLYQTYLKCYLVLILLRTRGRIGAEETVDISFLVL